MKSLAPASTARNRSLLAGERRDHDDGHIRNTRHPTDLAGHGETVHLRHHDVEQHQIDRGIEQGLGLGPSFGQDWLIARLRNNPPMDPKIDPFVVDRQDAFGSIHFPPACDSVARNSQGGQ
jgi:hypothetical protein